MKSPVKLPVVMCAEDYSRHFHDEVWREAASLICLRHGIQYEDLRRSTQSENIIFFIDDRLVLKIYAPFRNLYLREKRALWFALHKLSIETPQVVHTGELEGWAYIIMTRLPGLLMREVWPDVPARERVEIVSRLGLALCELHSHAPPAQESACSRSWDKFIEHQARTCLNRQRACGASRLWLERLPAYLTERLRLLPVAGRQALLHGDVHPGNVLLKTVGGRWRVAGLFDFADSLCGFHEYEFVAPGVLMVQGNRELQRALLMAYGYTEAQLDSNLRARLMLLTVLYECSDLRKYALRLAPDALHLTLDEMETAIWRFVDE
jgi:hygromycin-B 7''-O-kinase